MVEFKYPVRARIIDVTGQALSGNPDVLIKTPDVSKPHVGKEGRASQDSDGDIVLMLDDGTVLYGYECWWEPVI